MSEPQQKAGHYQHVFVAVDLAVDNQRVMDRAMALRDEQTRVSLVHVIEPAYFYYGLAPGYQIGMPSSVIEADEDQEAAMIRRAQGQFDQLGEVWNVAAENRHLERGHAANKILTLAERLDVDLIVVGSHGRHGLQLLLGSTASAVLHRANTDVLAVRVYD